MTATSTSQSTKIYLQNNHSTHSDYVYPWIYPLRKAKWPYLIVLLSSVWKLKSLWLFCAFDLETNWKENKETTED